MANEDLFLSFVEATEGCWYWTGYIRRDGYGHFRGRPAHRFAYERTFGQIPAGFEIDHICRVRNCVNPFHLEAVTRSENQRRSAQDARNLGRDKGAQIQRSKDTCPKGHSYSGSNLYHYKGHRDCNTCKRERNRRWRESKTA